MWKINNKCELIDFITNNILSTSEVASMLNCSRQYIDKLVKQGKLKPVKSLTKANLFLKSDIEDIIK